MGHWMDAAALGFARLLTRVFYRSVEIRGAEHVPAEGPVIFVANHGNSLVDPLLLVALLPRRVRFLAKSTLWKNPLLMPFLRLFEAIPVYRQQDGVDTGRNQDTFARCHEELAAGAAIALFPEGISHDEPQLQPLKTGAARIALGAEAAGAASGVRIVPVGLTFEEKGRFRSRALLVMGPAIETQPERSSTDLDAREAARSLTARIDAGLREVTLNFPSWELSTLVERAADVFAEEQRTLPGRPELGERFSLRKTIGDRYASVREKFPERTQQIESMAHHYDGMLRALALRDDQVTAQYPWKHARAYLGDRLAVLLLGLPIAIVGTLLNYLPYRIPGWVGLAVSRYGDLPATYKILTGVVLMPTTWALEAWAASSLWGLPAGILSALTAPVTGFFALVYMERNASMWREILAYLTLRWRPERAGELRALRADIRREIAALVADAANDGR